MEGKGGEFGDKVQGPVAGAPAEWRLPGEQGQRKRKPPGPPPPELLEESDPGRPRGL